MSAEDYVVKNTDQQALQACSCNAGCRNDGNPMKVLDPPYSGKNITNDPAHRTGNKSLLIAAKITPPRPSITKTGSI
ncbi:MAG: hypothetical protein WBL88_02385 [Nitrososphaeraceae archaeon]